MKKMRVLSAAISAAILTGCFTGITAGAADNAVKITAAFDDSNRLVKVESVENISYDGNVAAVEGKTIYIWNSLKGQEPLCPPIVYSAETTEPTATAEVTARPSDDPDAEYTVTIGNVVNGSKDNIKLLDPNATEEPTPSPTPEVTAKPTEDPNATPVPGTVTWSAAESGSAYYGVADPEPFTVGDLKVDLLPDPNWKAGKAVVDGDVLTGEGNPKDADNKNTNQTGNAPVTGTAMKLSASAAGQASVDLLVNSDKSVFVYSFASGTTTGGTQVLTDTPSAKGVYTYKFEMTPDKDYYVFLSGSKMGISAISFAPSSASLSQVEKTGALVDELKAKAGDTVTVAVKGFAPGGDIPTITTDPETNIAYDDADELKAIGYYTFTMPAANVAVNAEYEQQALKDERWTTLDADLVAAATAAGDKAAFGPVNGISGYGDWKSQSMSAEYTHTDGTTYSFTSSFRAGSGNATRRSFCFTPKQACIVTVAYAAQAGRPVYIYQGKTLLASGEEGLSGGQAATIVADVEDPSAGDVLVYGGSSNKDIFGIFADYYDPNVLVLHNVSGKINYTGAADKSALKLVFKDTKDGTEYKADFADTYSIDVRQNRSYDVYVEENGAKSESVSTTLNTNSFSIAKLDKEFDVDVVDIALTEVTGDVVVHDVYNDGTSLDLSGVTLTFTAEDNAEFTYTTGITDNKIAVTMMPNHNYKVTAAGNDGYSLSQLSGSYLMAAGDTAPFKNILFTEDVNAVDFKSSVEVGADKEFAAINDAVTAIKKMTRPAGEDGRVAILVAPGTYTEQVIADADYITIKAADEANKPVIEWYYGIGYLYYSSAGNQYYSEDYAVAKTKKGTVGRWGAAIRVTGNYFIIENVVVKNTFNIDVTDAELADGSEPAMNNEYSDTNGKPDRTVEGYDAMAQAATERAAAIVFDGNYGEAYNCEFISSQDTFYTNNTVYVKDCYIEGNTDYIFGGNSVVFDGCTLAWHGYSDTVKGGYLTANKNSAAPGTAAGNGYLLKNCTVANSKYFPENKFAAGSWGRNWGGANTQVVYDGIKMDGTELPGAWVQMGGVLTDSVLYVTNVTDKDGGAVDVSGTAYNPNGTMEANSYAEMSMTDYFGSWTPAHYTAE